MGPCPLLELPAELRNQIFALAVVETEPQHLFTLSVAACGFKASFHQPALTRVNRQIRSEALSIFYGQSVFRIDDDLPPPARNTQVKGIFKARAFKHVRSIIYRFNASSFTVSKPNEIGIHLDEEGTLQYRVEGRIRLNCICALYRALEDLNKPQAKEAAEAVAGSMKKKRRRGKFSASTKIRNGELSPLPDALLLLHCAIVPNLIKSIGVGWKEGWKECSDCGKLVATDSLHGVL
ncbi:hypothetical protein LTR56_003816 [Elasticomyces elasticus]|nr:hypothetical protein LTR22_013123 [Elasticomyces elasticus]KAK3654958.1 hypothetical protein LTR56_003816 [Elasticomyces elasticus]KAK4928710.1 hypothetical protein LTR49_004519 [Elasticomyces elasticus]KAK5766662.1 hypothetical protein LTS12_003281 [Elasticomyces elasticus]